MSVFAQDFELSCHPSLALGTMMLGLHGLAISGVWLAALTPPMQWAFTLVVLVSLIHTMIHDVLLRGPASVRRVSYSLQNWTLILASGEACQVTPFGSVFVMPWLIVMRFRHADGRRFAVPVFVDGTSSSHHRRARVVLRLGLDQP